MNKRRWFLRACVVVVAIVSPLPLLAHFLGYSSVDGGDIRYSDYTDYDDARRWAISRWNEMGTIDILPDRWWTINDLKWKDTDRSDVSWAGRTSHRPWPGQEDYITLNKFYLRNFTTDRRRNVALHEQGHTLGLAHSFAGQVMYAFVSTLTTLQNHDKADYNQLW
jgi:hypothetical protein